MNTAKAEQQIRAVVTEALNHGVPPGHLLGMFEIIKSDLLDLLRNARVSAAMQQQPEIMVPFARKNGE